MAFLANASSTSRSRGASPPRAAFYALVSMDGDGGGFAGIFTEHRSFQIFLRPRAHEARYKSCETLAEAMAFMQQHGVTHFHWAFRDGVLEDFSHDTLFGNWVSTRWRGMYDHTTGNWGNFSD